MIGLTEKEGPGSQKKQVFCLELVLAHTDCALSGRSKGRSGICFSSIQIIDSEYWYIITLLAHKWIVL